MSFLSVLNKNNIKPPKKSITQRIKEIIHFRVSSLKVIPIHEIVKGNEDKIISIIPTNCRVSFFIFNLPPKLKKSVSFETTTLFLS